LDNISVFTNDSATCIISLIIFWADGRACQAGKAGFPFIVVLCRLFFCKQYGSFLRQHPPALPPRSYGEAGPTKKSAAIPNPIGTNTSIPAAFQRCGKLATLKKM